MKITCAWCLKDTHGNVDRYANRNFCKGSDCLDQYKKFVDGHSHLELQVATAGPPIEYGPWIGVPFDE